jgi:hypothetical protein
VAAEADIYRCPGGETLATNDTVVNDETILMHRASKYDCDGCALKPHCCPNTPARKVPRSIYEGARDLAREIAQTDAYIVSRRERTKVEMLFAHLKRILQLRRLRLRGPCGARDEFLLTATAQNLRKLAKLIPNPQTMSIWFSQTPPNPLGTSPSAAPRPINARLLQQNRRKADIDLA